MALPEAKHIAGKLTLKYEQSLYIAPTSLSQQEGLGANNEKEAEGKLIYFYKSVDYCTADPNQICQSAKLKHVDSYMCYHIFSVKLRLVTCYNYICAVVCITNY